MRILGHIAMNSAATYGCTVILSVALSVRAKAQTDSLTSWVGISAGMGISAMSAPSMIDYINGAALAVPSEKIGDFTTVTEFVVAPEVQIANDWSVGLEYVYLIKSFSLEGGGTTSRFEYSAQQVGVFGHYLVTGEHWGMRLGGGGSIVSGRLSQALYGSSAFSDFDARGGSVKMEAIADSQFDDHFYGMIGADLKWTFGQAFHRGSIKAQSGSLAPSLSSFTLGLKLGVNIRL